MDTFWISSGLGWFDLVVGIALGCCSGLGWFELVLGIALGCFTEHSQSVWACMLTGRCIESYGSISLINFMKKSSWSRNAPGICRRNVSNGVINSQTNRVVPLYLSIICSKYNRTLNIKIYKPYKLRSGIVVTINISSSRVGFDNPPCKEIVLFFIKINAYSCSPLRSERKRPYVYTDINSYNLIAGSRESNRKKMYGLQWWYIHMLSFGCRNKICTNLYLATFHACSKLSHRRKRSSHAFFLP